MAVVSDACFAKDWNRARSSRMVGKGHGPGAHKLFQGITGALVAVCCVVPCGRGGLGQLALCVMMFLKRVPPGCCVATRASACSLLQVTHSHIEFVQLLAWKDRSRFAAMRMRPDVRLTCHAQTQIQTPLSVTLVTLVTGTATSLLARPSARSEMPQAA